MFCIGLFQTDAVHNDQTSLLWSYLSKGYCFISFKFVQILLSFSICAVINITFNVLTENHRSHDEAFVFFCKSLSNKKSDLGPNLLRCLLPQKTDSCFKVFVNNLVSI